MPIFRVYIPLTGFAGYDVEADNADDDYWQFKFHVGQGHKFSPNKKCDALN